AAHLTLFINGTHIVYGLDLGNNLMRADNNYESDLEITTPQDPPELEVVLKKFAEVEDKYFFINDQEAPGGITEEEEKYFWYSEDPLELDFTEVNEGDPLEFQAVIQVGDRKGNKKRFRRDIEKIKPGDRLIGHHSVHGMAGVYTLLEAETPLRNDRIRLRVTGCLSRPLAEKKIREKVTGELHFYEKSVQQLDEETYREIENLFREEEKKQKSTAPESTVKFKVPEVDFAPELKIESLYFPPKVEERLIKQIQLNIRRGKHLLFAGAPGTGKSGLAREVCEFYLGGSYDIVTASPAWTAGDTIGHSANKGGGEERFVPGLILDCFREGKEPANRWLIMDEINRVAPEKIFGPLFIALAGDRVVLEHKTASGDNIVIKPQAKEEIIPRDNIYIIPKDWRIIATVNTFTDYVSRRMNGALRRRFAVIPVPAPADIKQKLVESYLDCWDIEDNNYSGQIAELWGIINEVQKTGPAIIEEVYSSLLAGSDYASAVINYVLPQFVDLDREEIMSFVSRLDRLDFFTVSEIRWIEEFVEDYF
ncbi:MAG: AAA family ATPase, partial [Halanaerobiaceae bacterium]